MFLYKSLFSVPEGSTLVEDRYLKGMLYFLSKVKVATSNVFFNRYSKNSCHIYVAESMRHFEILKNSQRYSTTNCHNIRTVGLSEM